MLPPFTHQIAVQFTPQPLLDRVRSPTTPLRVSYHKCRMAHLGFGRVRLIFIFPFCFHEKHFFPPFFSRKTMPRHSAHCKRSSSHPYHTAHTQSPANMEFSQIVPTNVNHAVRPPHNSSQKIPPNMAPRYPPPHSHIHSSPRNTLVQHTTRPATPLAHSPL